MNRRPYSMTGTGLLFFVIAGGTLWAQGTAAMVPGLDAALAARVSQSDTPARPHNDTFVIGNDDELAINVWKVPELTQTVPVRSDGKISLPLIGDIQAAGKTPLQLEEDITQRLKAYITDPQVAVIVQKINSEKYNILGRVSKPGSYSLTTSTTVLDAIAEAGGFLDFAKEKSIYILRERPGGGEERIPFNYKEVIKGKKPQQNITLQPHDTIIVP